MTTQLTVGLSSWIIQDGNYGDFERGARAAFALEFFSESGLDRASGKSMPSLLSCGGANYKATGQIVYASDDWWAVAFGPLAFQDGKPPSYANLGNWVTGSIYIGIDPFFYFERLALLPNAPALIYEWQIEKIEMQTAPFIQDARLIQRDEEKLAWKEIAITDAWNDDEGRGDYLLHCRLLHPHPRHRR